MVRKEQNDNVLGKRLDKLIKEKYSSRERFASDNNLSKTTVDKHCNGQNMNVSSLMDYARIFGVSTDYLLFGKDSENSMKKEAENENQIPLREINKGIMFLIKFFGTDIIEIRERKYGEKAIEISIDNTRLAENALKIKKLMELIRDDDGSIKNELEKGLETVVNAENIVVEYKCFDGNSYIYNIKDEKLELKSDPDIDDKHSFEILEIIDDEHFPF